MKRLFVASLALGLTACGINDDTDLDSVVFDDATEALDAGGNRFSHTEVIRGTCDISFLSDAGCPSDQHYPGGEVQAFGQGQDGTIENLRARLGQIYGPGSQSIAQEQIAMETHCGTCVPVIDCQYWEGAGRVNASGRGGVRGQLHLLFHCEADPAISGAQFH